MGPSQALILPVTGLDAQEVTEMTEEALLVALIYKWTAFNHPLVGDCHISTACNIMHPSLISLDLPAGLVYDRLLKQSTNEDNMIIHTKDFLRDFFLFPTNPKNRVSFLRKYIYPKV